MAARAWIETDETAKEMLSRVLTKSPPFQFRPPLHRLPLRAGNVVEITGPSPSAKTHILIHAAIDCILPGQWKGVDYGGLDRLVVYIDLDCKFDVLRLSHLLKLRITEAGSGLLFDDGEELHSLCMKRFLYVRCYSSLEFLSALKTLHHQLVERVVEEEVEEGSGVHCLMIDNIGAFHWMDRAVSSAAKSLPGCNGRRGISLDSIVEAVVREMKKVLVVHPMLVMVTKATVLGGDRSGSNDVTQNSSYREFMPLVWQSFVTHRLLVRAVDDDSCEQTRYLLEWLLSSPRSFVERFLVKDAGLSCDL
ncbi:unnamed protein product [Linum tenue]|uniref:RecA family profile 1 domain-containing protein n=1 Tax=Linum tenue TaxID=586396 RepID=A0AAV0ILK5_9ROSI|nr:unnamed protein product [Linum tenue]